MIRYELGSQSNMNLLLEVLDSCGLLKPLSEQKKAELVVECKRLIHEKSSSQPTSLLAANKEILTELARIAQRPVLPSVLSQPLDVSYAAVSEARRTEFDSELAKRRREFEESVAPDVPEIPEFEDKGDESEPVDVLLERMTKERNLITNQDI